MVSEVSQRKSAAFNATPIIFRHVIRSVPRRQLRETRLEGQRRGCVVALLLAMRKAGGEAANCRKNHGKQVYDVTTYLLSA